MPRLLRLVLASLLALVPCACGGGGSEPAPDPFVVSVPETTPVGTPPATTPPPSPPRAPTWRADAYDLERVPPFGAFPSDLVVYGRTLFVVDADQIEADGAWIRAVDIGGAGPVASTIFADTRIGVESLVDADGVPADLAAPIGFGFYMNDIAIVDDTLAFALVNAGGSDSNPPLSNLVVFDPSAGTVLQTVNLAWELGWPAQLLDSAGGAAAGNRLLQSGAEALAYVDTPAGPRLVVAMTNLLFGAPSYGAVRQRGTLQVYDVVPGGPNPVRTRTATGQVTQTLLTQDYNPVALHVHDVAGTALQAPVTRLLVTCGGTTAYDSSFIRLVPVTDASVEVYDMGPVAYEGRFRLGLAGLAGTRPAVGRDATGNLVGFYPSSVTGEIYVLRLDGLDTPEIQQDRLAVLRGPGAGLPVTLDLAGGPGGNLAGCALSPDGRSLVVTSFGDLYAFPTPIAGTLRVLALPTNVVTGGGFGPNFVPGTGIYATVAGRTLGPAVLRPDASGRPDVFVLVGGAIDGTTYLGSGPASIGTLTTHGLLR